MPYRPRVHKEFAASSVKAGVQIADGIHFVEHPIESFSKLLGLGPICQYKGVDSLTNWVVWSAVSIGPLSYPLLIIDLRAIRTAYSCVVLIMLN
jgi:hypothetical protein